MADVDAILLPRLDPGDPARVGCPICRAWLADVDLAVPVVGGPVLRRVTLAPGIVHLRPGEYGRPKGRRDRSGVRLSFTPWTAVTIHCTSRGCGGRRVRFYWRELPS